MATTDFLPGREAQLVSWVSSFKALIVAQPQDYGLSAPLAEVYETLADDFIEAYKLANADATRSPSNIVRKRDAKRAVIANTRMLAHIVHATTPTVTDQQKSNLGLTVRKTHLTPIPRPKDPPTLRVISRLGTMVRIRLHGGGEDRGKPRGVQGARVYSFLGTAPPDDLGDWKLEGQATRPFVDLQFPADTAPGTCVWLMACWYNPRGQTGLGCQPVSTYIAGGALPMRDAA